VSDCARCQHAHVLHTPDCKLLDAPNGAKCSCPSFERRLDPTPPDGRDWDDSDDEGTP
jgi:hypothetical protein